jgi:hypothetical protein
MQFEILKRKTHKTHMDNNQLDTLKIMFFELKKFEKQKKIHFTWI